ncbi:MAG: ABC transporter permease subunit [Nitrospirae bacterium]|nr:ABC transporter permease subunit [Nitrospirota bacterium]
MAGYIVRRLIQLVLVLFFITMLLFVMMKIAPGDPARLLAGVKATPEIVAALQHNLGLDQPWPVQYVRFVSGIFNGKLRSMAFGVPIYEILLKRLPASVELGTFSLLLAIMIALPAGIVSAVWRDSVLDYSVTALSLGGISIPVFWLALMLMILFSVTLHWLPVSGRGATIGAWSFLTIDGIRHMIIPVISLAAVQTAMNARLTRSSMLEVLGEDYITTARAKGLRERTIIISHAFRNALLPVVTNLGLQAGTLVAGAVLTETTTAWPGIGRLMYEAITRRDETLVFGLTLFIAIFYLFATLAVDIMYAYIDPRITYD